MGVFPKIHEIVCALSIYDKKDFSQECLDTECQIKQGPFHRFVGYSAHISPERMFPENCYNVTRTSFVMDLLAKAEAFLQNQLGVFKLSAGKPRPPPVFLQ